MQRDASAPILSVVLVDYDNIYLSLKRKSEDAAKRFSKDAAHWVREIVTGGLITPTGSLAADTPRRLVMNRCYGNPVPRRNQTDNATDMNSFPFVRHHFLRAGFEIIDCPPLTAQLKNSSDIRMVMDIRDLISHATYFDEFVILSGDADFTPVLHRLRAHARRTVIFANDSTAAPYTALADGEVREADLLSLLLNGKVGTDTAPALAPSSADLDTVREQIIAEVAKVVRDAPSPQPLEVLAERAMRVLGHERTAGTNWAGVGGFRELLVQSLPDDIRLSEQPPYYAYDVTRVTKEQQPAALQAPAAAPASQSQASLPVAATPTAPLQPSLHAPATAPARREPRPTTTPEFTASPPLVRQPATQSAPPAARTPSPKPAAAAPAATPAARQPSDVATQIQQSIARIHDACQAPPLAPPEYRMVFEILANEIADNQLRGDRTIERVVSQAEALGVDLRREDVRFILDVVSEEDPWLEQGVSANLFASRFRNFVVSRCRTQGLSLSADEIDLIDAWFAAGVKTSNAQARSNEPAAQPAPTPARTPIQPSAQIPAAARAWWEGQDRIAVGAGLPVAQTAPAQAPVAPQASGGQSSIPVYGAAPAPQQAAAPGAIPEYDDDFPLIVRSRLRR